jgi:hypothetical protein
VSIGTVKQRLVLAASVLLLGLAVAAVAYATNRAWGLAALYAAGAADAGGLLTYLVRNE